MQTPLGYLDAAVPSEHFAEGETIFREGDLGYQMYILRSGEINLMLGDVLLESLTVGATFGELALLDPAPRRMTAIAQTDCEVVSVNAAAFRALVEKMPEFAITVMSRANQQRRLVPHRA